MYGPHNPHRGMGPANSGNSRLNELLDQVRVEFESQARSSGEYEQQFMSQVTEMETIRQKLQYLESNQLAIKQRYDEDIARLRQELEARGGPPSHLGVNGLPGAHGASQPPAIGHGPSNLFGTIMTNPPGQGNSGLVPPQPQEHPAQPQGAQHQMPQPPPGLHQQPYQNYAPGPVNGYAGPNSQMMASPGPGKGRNIRGPSGQQGQGPATPQQSQATAYNERVSPRMGRQSPPLPPQAAMPDVGNQLADLDFELLHDNQKRSGPEWHAVFNPRVRRALDIELLQTLYHESVVCCVRFSLDGRYIATGCNRVAQIYDVQTGNKLTVLEDKAVEKDGDLYIRSVCFSPDGKYLATGAEDRQIRVWDIQRQSILQAFTGHEQDIYSLDFSQDGQYIASGSGDRTVRLWDLNMGREKMNFSIEDGVTTVAISPRGDLVAAGSLDKSVRVWDTRSGNLLERLDGPVEGHTDSVYSVAFAPDGRSLVSGSLDKTIKMWQLGDDRGHGPGRVGKCIRTFEGHKDFVLSVALTPDGRWVLSGSKDRGVQFWNPNTGDAQLMLQGHKNSVISVAPSPTGELFATGSGDTRAKIWRYTYL